LISVVFSGSFLLCLKDAWSKVTETAIKNCFLKAFPMTKLFAFEEDQGNSQDYSSSSNEICPYEDPNEDPIGDFNSAVKALPVVEGDIKIDLNKLLFSESTSDFEPDEESEEESELLNIRSVKS